MNKRTQQEQDDVCLGRESLDPSNLALRAIIEGTTDVVYAKNKAGRYVQCNASAARFLGRRSEDVIGQDDRMLFPSASANNIIEQDRLVMAQGKTVTMEETLTVGNGEPRTFLTTKGPIVDDEGQVCGLFVISRDITERKQIEENLREAHTAVELAMEGIAKLDAAGRYLFVNEQYAALVGYRPEELVGQSWELTVHPDARAGVLVIVEHMLATGRGEGEICGIRKDGSIFYKHVVIVKPVTAQGTIAGHYCFIREITTQQEVEQALRASEERWQLSAKGRNDGMWDWNIATGKVFYSPRWVEMRGYEAHEVTDTEEIWRNSIHPDDLNYVMDRLNAYFSRQSPEFCEEYRVRRKDGSYMWILDRGVALWDEQGRPIRMVGSDFDVTERKQAEALQEAEKQVLSLVAKGQSLADVLAFVCRAVETHTAPMLCSVMLANHEGTQLSSAAAPSLPDEYTRAVDGISIGPTIGSCGSAAYFRRPAIVADISTDPLWSDYANLALAHGLKSCWSHPIMSATGTLLGTFAVYYREPHEPKPHDLKVVERASHVAALAIEHARMLQALRDSEERHRSIVAAMAEGVVIQDEQGGIRSCNTSACRILGLSEDQILGRTALDPRWKAIHEDGSPFSSDTYPAIQTLRTGRSCENVVMGVHRPDESIVWISINTQPIAAAAGADQSLLGVVASFRDITGQKQGEADLKLFRALLDQVTDSIEVIDPSSGRFLDGNRRSYESIGYTRDELSRMTVPNIDPLVTRSAFQEYMRQLREAAVPLRIESLHLHKDGTTFPVEVVVQIIRHEREYVVAVVRDITERKQSEAALRDNEERLRTLYDDNPSMYFTVASDGTVLSVNRFGAELLGYRPDELIGGPVSDLVYEEDRAFVLEKLTQVFNGVTGRIESLEFRKKTKGGTIIWVQERARMIRTRDVEVVALIVCEDITARKKAEAALAEREEHLRLFIEHSPVSLAVFDREMRYLAVSRRFMAEYRLGDQPLIGRSHYDVFPEIPEHWKAIHRRCLAGAVECCEEDPLVRDDGRTDWSRWEIRPWWTAECQVGGIILFSEDITLRKQAETVARESEERFKLAVRATNDGIWDWNILTGAQYWSDRHLELFGFQPGALSPTYETWISLVHPDDADRVCQAMRRHLDRREPYDLEVRVRMKDGRYRWFHDRGQAIWDGDGRPVRMVGSISDVTERKSSEEALQTAHLDLERRVVQRTAQLMAANESLEREIAERKRSEEAVRDSETRYKLLADATFDGIAVHDQGTLLEVNAGLERMFGYRPGELIGRSILDLIAEESLEMVVAKMRAGVRGPYEAIGRRKDGSTFPGEVVVRPYRYGGKEVRLVAGRDITARKHLEAERLRQTEDLERQVAERSAVIAKLETQRARTEKLAAMGRLAAGVAHEINNPLAGIKNAFTLVRQAVDPAHPNAEFAGLIDREIARVASIIQNMYQLSRPETRIDEMVEVRTLVKDLEALLTPRLQQRRLRLVVDVMPSLQWLRVPRGDLMQVLLNLLTNAVESSPEGEMVTISLKGEADGVRWVVSDQGDGIEPEHLPHIFDPFYTTKTEREQKGMGLGLSVSQSLVQAMGGTIEVDTQVHRGSTFTICLPRERVAEKV